MYTGHYAEHKSRQKGPAVPAYAPRSVSITASGWPQFDDGFRNMLRGKLNSELGAPLSYVIRTPEFEEVTNEDRLAGYPSLLSDMERTIELKGAMFEADNRLVFLFLISLCQSDQSRTYIHNFVTSQDGRGAYLALYRRAMSTDVQTVRYRDAKAKLENLKYDGWSRGFTMDTYISKSMTYHNQLNDAGHPLSERDK